MPYFTQQRSQTYSVTLQGPSGTIIAFLEVLERGDNTLLVTWNVKGEATVTVQHTIDSPKEAQLLGLELTKQLIARLWA